MSEKVATFRLLPTAWRQGRLVHWIVAMISASEWNQCWFPFLLSSFLRKLWKIFGTHWWGWIDQRIKLNRKLLDIEPIQLILVNSGITISYVAPQSGYINKISLRQNHGRAACCIIHACSSQFPQMAQGESHHSALTPMRVPMCVYHNHTNHKYSLVGSFSNLKTAWALAYLTCSC